MRIDPVLTLAGHRPIDHGMVDANVGRYNQENCSKSLERISDTNVSLILTPDHVYPSVVLPDRSGRAASYRSFADGDAVKIKGRSSLIMLGASCLAYRCGLIELKFLHVHHRHRLDLRRVHDVNHRNQYRCRRHDFPAVWRAAGRNYCIRDGVGTAQAQTARTGETAIGSITDNYQIE